MERKKYEAEAIQAGGGIYKLEGVVSDEDGNPLADVDLSIKSEEDDEEYSAKTDSDGKFLVEDVSGGKYTVTIQSDIYRGSLDYDVKAESSDDSDGTDDQDKDDTQEESSTGTEKGEDDTKETQEDEDNAAGGEDSDAGEDDTDDSDETETGGEDSDDGDDNDATDDSKKS